MSKAGRRRASDPIGLRFLECDAGWIVFRIDALMPATMSLTATHLDDPFPRMVEWLEEICDGAPLAMWSFAEEGVTARLIFAEAGPDFLGGGSDRLILIEDGPKYEHFTTARVDRSALIREFYISFQDFTLHGYRPKEWEFGLPPHISREDLSLEEEDSYVNAGLTLWEGNALRALRSSKIEYLLRGREEEQLNLDLTYGDGV